MEELNQQELLQSLKAAIEGTWNDVAVSTGIAPRALKSYLLPVDSKGHRGMDKFVREAVEKVLSEAK
ncbi:hypothetical protein ACO0LB_17860 [Undibacterium sp. SXout7W]|uniref:hypothetical protein n=1 Tax=Undibacterium sp. SXout7W TaxID=3413049 RepID=UPI003BF3C082